MRIPISAHRKYRHGWLGQVSISVSLHILESPKSTRTWSEWNWNEEGNQNLLRFNLSRAVDFKDCIDSAQQVARGKTDSSSIKQRETHSVLMLPPHTFPGDARLGSMPMSAGNTAGAFLQPGSW